MMHEEGKEGMIHGDIMKGRDDAQGRHCKMGG